jgi:hypothetical protein
LDRAAVSFVGFIAVDAWATPVVFDPEKNGDQSHVVSAGPDKAMGTTDDIHSVGVKNLHLPLPAELLEERGRRSKPTTAPSP